MKVEVRSKLDEILEEEEQIKVPNNWKTFLRDSSNTELFNILADELVIVISATIEYCSVQLQLPCYWHGWIGSMYM